MIVKLSLNLNIPLMLVTEQQRVGPQNLLTEAYRSYGKELNLYALFKISNSAIGEDLVQETFLKTWRYLVRGGKIKIMKAFLYHTLNHLIVDQYRKHRTASLDTLIENGFERGDDHPIHLVNFLDGQQAIRLIHYLPAAYQKVLRMRYIKDLSLEEMSQVIGITKNATAVRVHRGLLKLKVLYAVGLRTGHILPPA